MKSGIRKSKRIVTRFASGKRTKPSPARSRKGLRACRADARASRSAAGRLFGAAQERAASNRLLMNKESPRGFRIGAKKNVVSSASRRGQAAPRVGREPGGPFGVSGSRHARARARGRPSKSRAQRGRSPPQNAAHAECVARRRPVDRGGHGASGASGERRRNQRGVSRARELDVRFFRARGGQDGGGPCGSEELLGAQRVGARVLRSPQRAMVQEKERELGRLGGPHQRVASNGVVHGRPPI